MKHTVKILKTEMLNHNVKHFVTEKPEGFSYTPGQAVLVELPERPGDKHPFTFTGLNSFPHLEFTIKLYHERHGLTDQLTTYDRGDTLQFGDPWGAIAYKGPGLFLAGGAGITPFLAILRSLREEGEIGRNALWFSNKTDEDIFLEGELREMLGDRLKLLVTSSQSTTHEKARIDRKSLEMQAGDFGQYFYVCGPDKMVKELAKILGELGAKNIVTEDLD